MTDNVPGTGPKATPAVAQRRKELTPTATEAFENFSKSVFAEGALDEQTKQLIAVAVAHVTQCPYCIEGHSKLATIARTATATSTVLGLGYLSDMDGRLFIGRTIGESLQDKPEDPAQSPRFVACEYR